MIRTGSWNCVFGSQPSTRFAFDASPISRSEGQELNAVDRNFFSQLKRRNLVSVPLAGVSCLLKWRPRWRRGRLTENQLSGNLADVKTTLDLPDELMREVKIRAVHERKKLKDAIAEFIRKGMAASKTNPAKFPKPVKLKGGFTPTTEDIEAAIAWGRD